LTEPEPTGKTNSAMACQFNFLFLNKQRKQRCGRKDPVRPDAIKDRVWFGQVWQDILFNDK
jgi:hypothetical protein